MFFYGKFIILGQKLQFIVITIVSLTNENWLQLKLSLSIYDVEFLHLLFMIITKCVTAYLMNQQSFNYCRLWKNTI